VFEKNRHKNSVSVMCETLPIARSTFYYARDIAVQKQQEKAAEEQLLKEEVRTILNENRQFLGLTKSKMVSRK